MFVLHKEIHRLEVPAQRVLLLQRSLSEVQIAIPGATPQKATAYLCVFATGKGYRIVVVLDLLVTRRLLFYLSEEGEVQQREASRILNEGIHFIESMGFTLSDLDFQRLSPEARVAMWNALPLKTGVVTPSRQEGVPVETVSPAPEKKVPAPGPVLTPIVPAVARSEGRIPPREQIPSAAEQQLRQKAFLANLGRFLASL